jgi:hypothetical protein
MELLEILPPLGLAAGQGDLRDLPHLRRPAAERFDELAKAEAAGRLRPELVLMGLLHADLY